MLVQDSSGYIRLGHVR